TSWGTRLPCRGPVAAARARLGAVVALVAGALVVDALGPPVGDQEQHAEDGDRNQHHEYFVPAALVGEQRSDHAAQVPRCVPPPLLRTPETRPHRTGGWNTSRASGVASGAPTLRASRALRHEETRWSIPTR